MQRRHIDTYWTEMYQSPEQSWLEKTVNKTSNWIYNGIDNFFKEPVDSLNTKLHDDSYNYYFSTGSQIEWELNQDIADIAFKDIRSSLGWIIPGFVRKFAIRLNRVFLLYVFTDIDSEEESSEWTALNKINYDIMNSCNKKILYTFRGLKGRIDSNCLTINTWCKKFIASVKVFLRLEEEKKTSYSPAYFAPHGNGHITGSQNLMIRGPDISKLYPAFSFHKRI